MNSSSKVINLQESCESISSMMISYYANMENACTDVF